MKVLCAKHPDTTMRGWSDAFTSVGAEFVFWDSGTKPVFDIFDETEPDVFIGDMNSITRGLTKCLKEYSNTVPLFYSPKYGSISQEDFDRTEDLARHIDRRMAFFSFCHESRLEEILGGWRDKGHNILSVMRSANTKLYYPKEKKQSFISDVSFISDYDSYFAPYILPLCHKSFGLNLKIRIFGNGWPVSQAIGTPREESINDIYVSSKIVLDIQQNEYEPSDTVFNVISSSGFCISNSVGDIGSNVPGFETPEELHDLVRKYLSNESYVTKRVIYGYVHHDMIYSLLNGLGVEE